MWAFIYPVWWIDCPAILKGWFDRVWGIGYAYEPGHTHPERALPGVAATMKTARRALVLCAAGLTEAELRESGCYQAMETVMMTDRISARAETKQFIVFGGSAVLDAETWRQQRVEHLASVRALGRDLRLRHRHSAGSSASSSDSQIVGAVQAQTDERQIGRVFLDRHHPTPVHQRGLDRGT
jgi:NAD(P)H dehydrogenase (quinone)